jgi:hypothetical protein
MEVGEQLEIVFIPRKVCAEVVKIVLLVTR